MLKESKTNTNKTTLPNKQHLLRAYYTAGPVLKNSHALWHCVFQLFSQSPMVYAIGNPISERGENRK